MNNIEYNKFLGKLYDILLKDNIISYQDKAKDLKTKKERLENYLSKVERVQDKLLNRDKLNLIKELYYDRYIIKRENIPDTYFDSLERKYLEEGYGHIHLVNPTNEKERKLKAEHLNTVIREQKDSLDNWLNYLLCSDSSYLPIWAKVWAFQGMLHIGNLNENKDGYKTRSKTTVNPFVSFDPELLGKCVELLKESLNKKELISEEIDKVVVSGSFAKLYGRLLANKKALKIESDDGIWVKYNSETEDEINKKIKEDIEPEYIKLYNSLQGYNTGWCTAGSKKTAKKQICGGANYLGGDFYVYYSKDKNNEYKIPRIAIRMEGNNIGEIRGIADSQNIESNMEKVLEEKLKEFPYAKMYQKKVSDMKKLTEIYNKYINKIELLEDDLRFLYEIDDLIIGFGYQEDSRIKEILNNRNKIKDLLLFFDCIEDEIVYEQTYDDFDKKIVYLDGDIDRCNFVGVKRIVEQKKMLIRYKYLGNGSDDDINLLFQRAEKYVLCLPRIVRGYVNFGGLISSENIVFPQVIKRSLYLESLKSAKGMVFPKSIGGNIELRSLNSLVGVILPGYVGGYIYYKGKKYSLEEIKEIQELEEREDLLRNNDEEKNESKPVLK